MAKKKIDEPSAPLWYVSFSDLVTNMLCFFVMLFAFSSLDSPKKRQEAEDKSENFFDVFTINQNHGANKWLTQGGQGITMAPGMQRNEPAKIIKSVKNKLAKVKMADRLHVVEKDQQIKIIIPTNLLFESGNATLKKSSEEILMALSSILGSINNYIRIDGHTDNIPPAKNSAFPSNWELSAMRAVNVVKYFVTEMKMNPDRLSAQGYSDTRPKVSNATPEGREQNRRVEIIILNKKLSSQGNTW